NRARRHHDGVRALGEHVLRLRRDAGPDLDAELADLQLQPARRAVVVLALRRAFRDEELASELRRLLEEHDPMPAQAQHPRRLHAGDAAADDHHLLHTVRPRYFGELRLEADRGVLDTGDRHAAILPVDATLVVAHALADVVDAPLARLRR